MEQCKQAAKQRVAALGCLKGLTLGMTTAEAKTYLEELVHTSCSAEEQDKAIVSDLINALLRWVHLTDETATLQLAEVEALADIVQGETSVFRALNRVHEVTLVGKVNKATAFDTLMDTPFIPQQECLVALSATVSKEMGMDMINTPEEKTNGDETTSRAIIQQRSNDSATANQFILEDEDERKSTCLIS